jgi:UDP-N-acetylmuramate-alanine ligase
VALNARQPGDRARARIDFATAAHALAVFGGIQRRFEVKGTHGG